MEPVNEIKTEEEAEEYRNQVIADMEAEDAGEPAAVTKEPEEEPPKPIEEEDPWAGVNPALREQFDGMSKSIESLTGAETRLKQAESRIGAITNDLHAAKQAAKEIAAAPSKEQMADAAALDKKWDELKEDFPDWAEAIDGRLAQQPPGVNSDTIKQEIADLRESMKEETDGKIEKAVLSFAHPGWEDTINSNPYKEWLKEQPEDVVLKTRSLRAVDAISVLDGYAGLKAKTKSAEEIARQRQSRLRSAVDTPGMKATPPKSESDMNESEYRAKIGSEIFAEN